jgi:putative ABC transport system permease protein
MEWIMGLGRRLLMLVRRRQFDRDLEEEMRLHRELREQQHVEAGMTPDEAHYAALQRFGNVVLAKERSRQMWGWKWVEDLVQDIRYGLRMLAKNPGFTTVGVLTLALGIGANTAIFTLVDAVILEPLPYPQPDRLVALGGRANKPQNDLEFVHPGEFLEWRNHARSFESLVLTQNIPVNAQGQGGAEQISGLWTTSELFQVFGVMPALGRAFTDQETGPGGSNVTILSHGYWQGHFGADPKVLGKTIDLYGQPNTIIGVMPAGFRVATLNPDVYLPMPLDPAKPEAVGSRSFQCFGRLRPGVTISSAQAEMTVIEEQVAHVYPALYKGWGVTVLELHNYLAYQSRPVLLTLLGVVACVLLIACANLASLLLTRGVGRRSELAVRASLGAGRLRLVQQLVVESVLLSAVGGAPGLVLGLWASRLLLLLGKDVVSPGQVEHVHLNVHVLAFTMALTLLTAILSGMMPAWQASRFDLQAALQEQGRAASEHRGQRRLRAALVVGEVALSVVLLVGAGLLLRTFSYLLRVNLGFEPDHVLTGRMLVTGDGEHRSNLVDHILDRVEVSPGVRAAGTIQFLPLGGWHNGGPFHFVDEPDPLPSENMQTDVAVVSRGYFAAMGIPLLQGRPFTKQDAFDSPRIAVVSRSFVRKYLPHVDPLGHRIIGDWSNPAPTRIVGVVGDIRQDGLTTEPRPTVYLAQVQSPGYITYVVVRTMGQPDQLAPAIRHAVAEVDSTQPVTAIQGMEQYVSADLARPRLYMALLGTFAGLALVLAVIGLYGLLAYTVTQRTHEIGIRIALGASPIAVLRSTLKQGATMTMTGLAIGVPSAIALSRLISTWLYGVTSGDSLTYLAVAGVLSGAGLLACYIPAHRAANVDPMVALRHE